MIKKVTLMSGNEVNLNKNSITLVKAEQVKDKFYPVVYLAGLEVLKIKLDEDGFDNAEDCLNAIKSFLGGV